MGGVARSPPFVGKRCKDSVRGEVVHVAAAWFGVFGKLAVQSAGQSPGQLSCQTDEQFMARKIEAEWNACRVVLPVGGL